ncbi:MAG: hypothetical protein GY772_22770 [bacterium]|nr:hypothetical protein [bacterium]
MNCPSVHVLVTTHTPRNLAGVLAGVVRQGEPPDSLTIASDSDDEAIGMLIAKWRPQLGAYPVRWVYRPHTGEARPSQTRNNAVRALLADGAGSDEDFLLLLDGDMVLADHAIGRYRALLAKGFDEVIAFRTRLGKEETGAFDPLAYAKGMPELVVPAGQRSELRARQRRYERHLRQRSIPFTKAYKPKMIGCHHAISGRVYRAVNGYDEEFAGYASEDDDFSRRVNQLRPRVRISIQVEGIPAFHLWHPIRGSASRKTGAAYQRYRRRDLPTYARYGLGNPVEQQEPATRLIE